MRTILGSLFYLNRTGWSFNEGCTRWPMTLLPVVSVLREPRGWFLYLSLWRPGGRRWRWSSYA